MYENIIITIIVLIVNIVGGLGIIKYVEGLFINNLTVDQYLIILCVLLHYVPIIFL